MKPLAMKGEPISHSAPLFQGLRSFPDFMTILITRVSSGRKIVEILQKNPTKDPKKYDEEDIAHMRKVVSYNKRHLAQEEKAKQDPESKSAKSLKNWGHDPQKTA